MTSSNVIDASQKNGQEKTPEQIQLEIARTRSAITEDLLAISEKLSPQHLREEAREVMKDAREEAKELLREAKDAAIGSLVGIKDRAVETVSERVSLIGTQARHAGDLTVGFVSANVVALSLLGASLGTGWLLLALRNRRNRLRGEFGYDYEYANYPRENERYAGDRARGRRRMPEQVRSVATQASHAVDSAREQIRSAGHQAAETLGAARSQIRSAAHDARENAGALGRSAGRSLRRAAVRTREVSADNRLTVVALTVAAGLGLGLLLPVGQRPRRALLGAGERAWDDARAYGQRLGQRYRGERDERPEPRIARAEAPLITAPPRTY